MRKTTSPLHGREAELALLRGHLERAVAGDQQLVLLEGDPGIGKSALLRAFARSRPRWQWRGPRIFSLQAPEGERYQPVHHSALAATDRRLYARLGGKRQATETARGVLMDWLGVIPIWGNLLEAIAGTIDVLRRRRRQQAFEEIDTLDEDIQALLAASHRRPLVLLLDDLDRADEDAIARLEALICTADEGARILIVGAYRPTAPGVPSPPVHRMVQRLPEENELFVHRRLAPLDRAAVQAWLSDFFHGSDIPEPFLSWLVGATGGHPGTIEATITHLVEKGAVRRVGGAWEFETDRERLDLPELGHSFADLSAVNPYIAEVVEAASVLGDDFDATTLSRLLERDELAVEDQLALGVHYGLLEHRGERVLEDGELTTAFRFASPHLRAALLRALSPQRREALENRAAEADLPCHGLSAPPPPTSPAGA